jgi:hypothetical protein
MSLSHNETHGSPPLAPDLVRAWARTLSRRVATRVDSHPPARYDADLASDFRTSTVEIARLVIPLRDGETIRWLDPSGRPLATSTITATERWDEDWVDRVDFTLDSSTRTVHSEPYL